MTNRSEIFDTFAALALKQGLISEAAESPRRGSDDISDIEALYGVKPNGSQDDKSIIEQAHPDMCVIAPAYDKLNGIVENLIERHNIMVGIVQKPEQAKLTQHRYASAKEDLLQELLRVGFIMDNNDEDELRVLADTCASDMTKVAWVTPVLGGLATAFGLIAAYNHYGAVDQGVRANCEGAIRELTDVLEDEDYAAVAGPVSRMVKNIGYVKSLADRIAAKSTTVPKATAENAAAAAESPELSVMEKMLNSYATACGLLAEQVPSYIALLETVAANPNKEYEAGWMATLKSVVQTVWTSDATDAVNYLKTLQGSLLKSAKEIAAIRKHYENYVEVNKDELIEKLHGKVESEKGDSKPTDDTMSDIEAVVNKK